MTRAVVLLLAAFALAAPASAAARAGDPDGTFGRLGTVTLKATDADAVGGAVKAMPDGHVLAGGAAGGTFVVVRLRRTGTLDRGFGTAGQVAPALPGTTLDGVRALAQFRDGRIVAAGTLNVAGGTRMAVVRLLPGGDIDPSFGGGAGYVLAGNAGSVLTAMVMDRNGFIYLGGSRAGATEIPQLIRLAPDGTLDPNFTALDGARLGLTGRVNGVVVRPTGTVALSIGPGDAAGVGTFTVVRLQPTGAPDPTFGGTGVVSVPLTPGSGVGAGAAAIHSGPGDSLLVAGTDVTPAGTLRGAVIRLQVDGTLDPRFGAGGVARIARAGRNVRFTGMARDRRGRILLAGSARAPGALVVRLRATGRRDHSFGTGGLTYPRLGRPPGGDPVFTTIGAIDAASGHALLAGSAAGPGPLVRTATGTTYGGRFALTVSRLR